MTKATRIGMAAWVLLGGAACSEAVPPAAQGAFRANWLSSHPMCAISTSFLARIGHADEVEVELEKNTVQGVEIYCEVRPSGSGFFVEGEMRSPETGVNVTFALDGLSNDTTQADPVRGVLSFASFDTAGSVYASPQDELCRFWRGSDNQEIAAGRAWFQFGCSQLTDGSVGSICGLQDNSTIAIQNCDQ